MYDIPKKTKSKHLLISYFLYSIGVKITSPITFLGTAGDSYVVGKQLRASGGIILKLDQNQFHIDPGPGSLVMAKQCGIELRLNTALLVSHNHLNHANDINAVISAMTYNGFDKRGDLIGNNAVINGTETIKPYLNGFYKNCLEKFIVLEEGQRVGINEVEIKALKAIHSTKTIGFKFLAPLNTLTYTSDTKYSAEVVEQYKNSNILILNVPYLKKQSSQESLSKQDAIKIINHVKPKLAIITHFGLEFLKSDPLYEIRDIKKESPCQVIAATDGMVVNPVSYSADQGQKTLKGFSEK